MVSESWSSFRMLTLLSIILVSEFLSKEHPLGLWRGIIGFGPAKVFIIFLRVLKDVWYSKPGFHLLDCMLRSAVGKTHDLRSDLWWTIPLRILLGPLSRVHFGESLVIRLYSEIDHIHLSSEAQCVSHLTHHLIMETDDDDGSCHGTPYTLPWPSIYGDGS